ncbi:MAG: hypothetical protein JSW25_08655 [Thermoplasmata archaeon]|nr:MAG: hypothetical protein JSW25_08655 [Thermoplasmata archaeon]
MTGEVPPEEPGPETAPPEPADDGFDPMGAPPVYEEPTDDLVSVDVEGRFPEIRRLKATGSLFYVLAGMMVILPLFLLYDDPSLGPRALLTLGLAMGGIAAGLAGMWSPPLRRLTMLAAPLVLVAAAASGTLGATLDTIPPAELALAFAFAASWLLALEHHHAVTRFVELGAYVTRQRLTTFSLGGVVNHFQIYGVGLVAIISSVAVVVVVGVPWVFARGSSGTFARSVELNSVFGMALAAAVVFTLSALILVFVRSVIPQRVDVERVAYSRDSMEDMLRSSQLLEPGEDRPR